MHVSACSIGHPTASKDEAKGRVNFVMGSNNCKSIPGYILNGKTAPGQDTLWHIRLDKKGNLYWNESSVGIRRVSTYLEKLYSVKVDEEFVSLEIENGTSCKQVNLIRDTISRSGLCAEGRCAENSWDVQRFSIQ
jgi:hypothetical protein